MNIWSNSCRICLQANATVPLFNEDVNKNVSEKLLLCLHEKVEEIEGYPKYICEVCNKTVNVIYKFINKYKESCEVLENHFLIKKELKYESDYDRYSEPEIEITQDLKIELPIDFEDANIEVAKKLPKEIVVKRVHKSKNINRKTNSIATSLLEKEYAWTGEEWCLSSTKTTVQKPRKVIGRQPTLNISKIKKENKSKVKKKVINIRKLCDLCGETFKDSDKLRRHRQKHLPRQKLSCTYENCNSILTSKQCLDRHIKRVHLSVSNYQCSECGKTYLYRVGLTNHLKSHNRDKYPEKLYKCKICDKSYKCQKSVDIHERSVHTGARPAVCSVCDAAFYHEEYLKQHMMLHTGETPFHCPVCDRGYNQRGNMKSHLRIHRISEVPDEVLKKIKPSLLKFLKVN